MIKKIARFEEIIGDVEAFCSVLETAFMEWGGSFAVILPDTNKYLLSEKEHQAFPQFCQTIRSTSEGNSACKRCDLAGSTRTAECGRTTMYNCHAGLLDVSIPIPYEGNTIATILWGHVLSAENRDHERSLEKIKLLEHKLGFSKGKLIFLWKKIPIISPSKIHDNIARIERVVKYLTELGFEKYKLRESLRAEHRAHLSQSYAQNQTSVFISYGGPDQHFAARLNEELKAIGVQTFLFTEDAIAGEKLHRVMRIGVNSHDKVILVCSKTSLNRPGVLNELEQALQREAREGGKEILIPITIDDYVFSEWAPERPDIATEIKERVVADFRKAVIDEKEFQHAIGRLIKSIIKK